VSVPDIEQGNGRHTTDALVCTSTWSRPLACDMHRRALQRIHRPPGRPPPNPGGYGPFSKSTLVKPPNGWLAGNLWTTEKVVHMWAKGLTTVSIPNGRLSARPDTPPRRRSRGLDQFRCSGNDPAWCTRRGPRHRLRRVVVVVERGGRTAGDRRHDPRPVRRRAAARLLLPGHVAARTAGWPGGGPRSARRNSRNECATAAHNSISALSFHRRASATGVQAHPGRDLGQQVYSAARRRSCGPRSRWSCTSRWNGAAVCSAGRPFPVTCRKWPAVACQRRPKSAKPAQVRMLDVDFEHAFLRQFEQLRPLPRHLDDHGQPGRTGRLWAAIPVACNRSVMPHVSSGRRRSCRPAPVPRQ